MIGYLDRCDDSFKRYIIRIDSAKYQDKNGVQDLLALLKIQE
jgi:hypothetical protein